REAPLFPCGLKLVLERALLDSVLPLAAVEGRLRLVEQRAVVVGLARWARAALAHQVHLARADHHVVAQLAVEERGCAPAVVAVEGREVDDRVEAAAAQHALEVPARAVAPQ